MSESSVELPVIERIGAWQWSPTVNGHILPETMRITRYRVGPLPARWELRNSLGNSFGSFSSRVEIRASRLNPISESHACDAAADRKRWILLFADRYAFEMAEDRGAIRRHKRARSQAEGILEVHPALREAARRQVETPLVVTSAGVATPCLAAGVPLYESSDTLTPRRSNLIAAAAPPPGVGPYWEEEIRAALRTAIGAWFAAVAESDGARVEMHGGWWGCGRLGGNRELMLTIQMLATALTGVDRLVLHVVDDFGARQAKAVLDGVIERLDFLSDQSDGSIRSTSLVDALLARRYDWSIPSAGGCRQAA
jgi:hypothetical protein